MTEHALSTSEERDRRYTIYLIVIAVLGSLLWTVLNEVATLTVTWLVIGVALGIGEGIATFFLPNIRPGQELEQIAT